MHSGCADPCDFPKCGKLDCIICGSGGLRSRSPLASLVKDRAGLNSGRTRSGWSRIQWCPRGCCGGCAVQRQGGAVWRETVPSSGPGRCVRGEGQRFHRSPTAGARGSRSLALIPHRCRLSLRFQRSADAPHRSSARSRALCPHSPFAVGSVGVSAAPVSLLEPVLDRARCRSVLPLGAGHAALGSVERGARPARPPRPSRFAPCPAPQSCCSSARALSH